MVGENFFGETVQNFTNYNPILKNNTQNLLLGVPGYAVYDYGKGERLTTTYPVFIGEKPEYFIEIVNPTKSLYSEINNVLAGEKLKTLSIIIGGIVAIVTLIIILIKWTINLNNQVKKRTNELEESNKNLLLSNQELAVVNEELKVHDRMQKEFINVASHEIKTPVQSILNFSELLSIYPEKQEEFIQSIQHNAIRLQRLSNEILDVTKIESKSLRLNKEKFYLNDLLSIIVNEYNDIVDDGYKQKVKLIFKPSKEILTVDADKERISGVLCNLLSNAVKFTKEGEIFVNTEKTEDNYALVTVRDTGEGIDFEILPKLFSKFVTSSFQGIGLGLYISKNIIEAHDGKIWAENNKEGRNGAIFYFTLPLNDKSKKKG